MNYQSAQICQIISKQERANNFLSSIKGTVWNSTGTETCFPNAFPNLKVSKFQKQILLFSLEPKNERNNLLISPILENEGILLY